MKSKRKLSTKIGNIVTAGATGLLLGYYLFSLFPINSIFYLLLIIPTLLFALWGYKHPISSESWSYVIGIFIFIMSMGNLSGNGGILGANKQQLILLLGSVSLVILNLFTGDLRIRSLKRKGKAVKRVLFRTLGKS